jgi:hypothetical protein
MPVDATTLDRKIAWDHRAEAAIRGQSIRIEDAIELIGDVLFRANEKKVLNWNVAQ